MRFPGEHLIENVDSSAKCRQAIQNREDYVAEAQRVEGETETPER